MKYLDGIKTEPKTAWELHERWKNNLAAQNISLKTGYKKIEVTQG